MKKYVIICIATVLIIFFGIKDKTKEKNWGEEVGSKQNIFSDIKFINSKFPYI